MSFSFFLMSLVGLRSSLGGARSHPKSSGGLKVDLHGWLVDRPHAHLAFLEDCLAPRRLLGLKEIRSGGGVEDPGFFWPFEKVFFLFFFWGGRFVFFGCVVFF